MGDYSSYLQDIWTETLANEDTNKPFDLRDLTDDDLKEFAFMKTPPAVLAHKLEARGQSLKKPRKQDTIPGFRQLPTCESTKLHKIDHKILIDAVFHGIKPSIANQKRFPQLKYLLETEHQLYLKHVQDKWKQGGRKELNQSRDDLAQIFDNMWQPKFDQLKNQQKYYCKFNAVPIALRFETESEFIFHCEGNGFEYGEIPELATIYSEIGKVKQYLDIPELVEKFDCEIKDTMLLENSPNLTNDKICMELVEKYKPDVVISSSTLKKLVSYHEANDKDWMIPLQVKCIEIGKLRDTKKKVVIFNKPLPPASLSNPDKLKWIHEKVFKAQFIDQKTAGHTFTAKCPEIKSNVTYRMWTLKPSSDTNSKMHKEKVAPLKILIRCKYDATIQSENPPPRMSKRAKSQPICSTPVSIFSKMEYQLNFGSECLSIPDLSSQWIHALIRPFSKIFRVLFDPSNSEMIYSQSLDAQAIMCEAQRVHQYNLKDNLAHLYQIFNTIREQPPDDYLLQHTAKNQSFAYLRKSSQTQGLVTNLDLSEVYDSQSVKTVQEPEVWKSIDTNVLLPLNEAMSCYPGLFQGSIKALKKSKRNKGNMKRKPNGQNGQKR